ncbi:MAG TPA: cell division protein ZapD [Gammaproteobacteria bacterium]|nr:cell division protein ZapD [Gammaproteobacteria bacterium]
MNNAIIYEHPLNEITRVALRLEQLFVQIDRQQSDTSQLGTRNIITSTINVLQLLDRPDLKSKLAKELSHHATNLSHYSDLPEVDAKKLKDLMSQLEQLSHHLIESSGKIGHRLRDIELLNTLRLHLASPGGGCSFDIPLFHYWLQQPVEIRRATINDWLMEFTEIRTAVTLVLDLVRKNATIDEKTAVHGFHQELLDPQANLRMIRLGISPEFCAFPEISVGRHFLSVRFYSPDTEKRPTQYPENLSFWLAYCNL